MNSRCQNWILCTLLFSYKYPISKNDCAIKMIGNKKEIVSTHFKT